MEPTREMKAQFTPEELENLSISEGAFLSDMDSVAEPTREMQKVFSPEELKDLSIKEEAFFADQELAEISTQKQRTPAQVKQAIFERARKTAEADAARRPVAKTPAETRLELIEELKRISKKRYDDMTREEDIIYNSSDHLTVRFREQIKEIRAGKRTDIDVEELTPVFEGRVEDYDITIADDRVVIAPKNKTGITVGTPVPQKTAKTQAQINLEAAKARGMAAGPVDEAAEYALKDAAGYFDEDYFNSFADDVVSESYEVLDGPMASIASSGKTAAASSGAAAASAVAGKVPTATRASTALSSAVSKGGKNAHLNLKTAAAASALGLAGGYVANRKRTRR